MNDDKYTIVEKGMSGTRIIGYVIKNKDNDNTKLMKSADIIKLALCDKIDNAHAILDTSIGKYIISIDESLMNIPLHRNNSVRIKLTGRYINSSKKCIGYKAIDNNGKSYKLSIQKTWELAEQGSVQGIEARITKGFKILNSTDECKLSELPIITN